MCGCSRIISRDWRWRPSVTLPITVTNLVVELTLFLLVLSPYLDLMDEAGVEPGRRDLSQAPCAMSGPIARRRANAPIVSSTRMSLLRLTIVRAVDCESTGLPFDRH